MKLRMLKAGRSTLAFLELNSVFGADLPADQRFCKAVMAAPGGLIEGGAVRTVAEFPEG
jgi:hypothetical protein